jgi:hypothetical protein
VPIPVRTDLTERQKATVLAGGLLNWAASQKG